MRDKSAYKQNIMEKLNKWTYFDTNMNNTLVEQRKILNRKNYELDSRANALKDYGYVPYVGSELAKKREMENIMFNNKIVGMTSENHQPYKKNYTPITTFQKSIIDCRVGGSGTGPKITQTRPNLNVS